MQAVLEKIKRSAATRLALPQGRLPSEELARYKTFLKIETHRLKILHRAGAGGLEVCHARATILDALLINLWNTAKSNLSPQAQKEFPKLALAAIGGYCRAGLNTPSDIHFIFLSDVDISGLR